MMYVLHNCMSNTSLKDAIITLAEAVPNVMARYEQLKDNLPELLTFYRQLKTANLEVEKLIKILKELQQDLSHRLIPDLMESQKTDNLGTGGYTYSLGVRTLANIPIDKLPQGLQWVKDIGCEGAIKEGINTKTLSSIVSDYIEREGLLPPEDAVTIYQQRYISVRKA